MDNRILIIDDEDNLTFFVKQSLQKKGYEIEIAPNLAEGRKKIESYYPDLLLLDLNLPDGYGLDFYRETINKNIQVPTIVITAHSSIQSAIDALKMGVDDYIAKPFDLQELEILIESLFEKYNLRNQLNYYRRKAQCSKDFDFFESILPQIKEIQEMALKIAEVPVSTTLIEGETGTGKEMMARFIHVNSAQAESPFVEINCASLPETLLESELFGYEAGAFTDARKRKIGLIELAKGGTLFLDEIGEMSIGLQAKLLRFLENHTFKRLGGVHDIKVKLRVIAATNQNIEQYVKEDKFREDLYYRLNMFRIIMPPLRERKEEILLIAQYFLEKLSNRLKRKIEQIPEECRKLIQEYHWPGNLRELNNVLERAIILSNNNQLQASHFPGASVRSNDQAASAGEDNFFSLNSQSLRNYIAGLEKEILEAALAKSNGNQVQAAKYLNEPRHIVRYLLKKHNLDIG